MVNWFPGFPLLSHPAETAKILNQMIRIKLQEIEKFEINDILDFLGTVENGNKAVFGQHQWVCLEKFPC